MIAGRPRYLEAGDYQIDVYVDYGTQPGPYHLDVTPRPAPEIFVITVGDTIADGTPAPGAGNLEQPWATDTYTFTIDTPTHHTLTGEVVPGSVEFVVGVLHREPA